MEESFLARVAALGELALSAYGPAGRSKAISASPTVPAGVYTTISARLFSGLAFQEPYIQLLLQLTSGSQQHTCADGGLLAVHIACSLIIAAYRNAHSHRGRAAIADAYEACLQDLVEFMGQAESQPTKPNTGTNVSSQRRRDSRQRRGQQEPWLQQYLAGTHSEDSNHSGDSCDGNDHDHRPSDWGQFERLATAGKGQQQEAQQGYSHPWSLCLRIEPQHGLVPAYMGLVRGVIGSKPGTGRSPSDKETVCWLLVKAFVSSLATGPAGANYTVPRILVVPGLTAEDFGIMEGVVLEEPQSVTFSSQALLPLGPSLVVIFESALEPDTTPAAQAQDSGQGTAGSELWSGAVLSSGLKVECHSHGSQGWDPRHTQMELLLDCVAALHRHGVRVLACQKGIHPEVSQAAYALGMQPLARLSAQHAQALAAMSGAAPIASISQLPGAHNDIDPSHLGVIGGVEAQVLAHKRLVRFLPAAQPGFRGALTGTESDTWRQRWLATSATRQPCCTVVLGAPCDACCDETQAVAHAAMSVLQRVVRQPVALPGGGAWQALAARHIRERLSSCRAKGRSACDSGHHHKVAAYEGVAQSLEAAAGALLAGSGLDKTDIYEALQALGSTLEISGSTIEYVGWNHEQQSFGVVASGVLQNDCEHRAFKNDTSRRIAVLDWLPAALCAITAGITAACTLLKVDSVVRCES